MRLDLKKLKRDLKEIFRWKNLWLYCVIFASFMLLALVIHECGHALAALLVGAKLEQVHVGLNLYPLAYHGFVKSSGSGAFAHGFLLFMGSGMTLLVSIVATICLLKRKLEKYAKAAVFFMSLYFLDILVDLVKRPVAGVTPTSREAVQGALEMGIPAWLTTSVVVIASILLIITIARFMLKPYIKK